MIYPHILCKTDYTREKDGWNENAKEAVQIQLSFENQLCNNHCEESKISIFSSEYECRQNGFVEQKHQNDLLNRMLKIN